MMVVIVVAEAGLVAVTVAMTKMAVAMVRVNNYGSDNEAEDVVRKMMVYNGGYGWRWV